MERIKQIMNELWQKLGFSLKRVALFLLPQKKSWRYFFVLFALISVPILFWQAKQAVAVDIMETIFHIVNYLLYGICYVLGWVAMKIFALIVVISAYNDFVNSPPVTKGWVLVRDTCNLFFVLALLMVAFAQILQVKNYSNMESLKKIIVAAVLVNFSKLICALIIDFGQVVMMTFVNGYAATAGGNLINGLGLQNVLKLSSDNAGGKKTGTDNLDLMAALALAIIVLIMTIIVTFYVLILLTMRIIQLWLLIVVSPVAFLASAIPLKGVSVGPVENFWKDFGWSVAIGPLMAFFLWLSLLMMANPQQMIKVDEAQLVRKEVGSKVKSGSAIINNMVQALIGILLLLGSLEMATKAGGFVGSQAGKMKQKAASVAMSISGVNKMQELGGRFEKKMADTSQAAVTRTFGSLKKAGSAVIAPLTVPLKQGYGEVKKLANKAKEATVGRVVKSIKGQRDKVMTKLEDQAQNGKGPLQRYFADYALKVMTAPSKAGNMEQAILDERNKKKVKEKIETGDKKLAARGIKSTADLQKLMSNPTESKEAKMAAANKLKEKGFADQKDPKTGKVIKKAADFAKEAQTLLAGDKEAVSAIKKKIGGKDVLAAYDINDRRQRNEMFEAIASGDIDLSKQKDVMKNPEFVASLKKEMAVNGDLKKKVGEKSAHLAYDPSNVEDMESMRKAFDKGDISLSEQADEFFENSDYLCQAQSGMGNKKFKAQMKKTMEDEKRTKGFEDKAKLSLQNLARDKRQYLVNIKKNPNLTAEEKKEVKNQEKALGAIVSVSKQFAEVYGSGLVEKPKDSSGREVANASAEIRVAPELKGVFEDQIEAMSAEDLADIDLGDKENGDTSGLLPQVARNLRVKQIQDLAGKKGKQADLIVNEIVKQCETVVDGKTMMDSSILAQIAGNKEILNAIDPSLVQKIKAMNIPTGEKKKDENEQETKPAKSGVKAPTGYGFSDGGILVGNDERKNQNNNNGSSNGGPTRGKIDLS
ncbi:MAG: hypothetical protein WCT18_03300 [Patescibacteria group bacterium]